MHVDKNNILNSLEELDSTTIELGCGPNKRIPNSIGIDCLDYECVDIVGDIFDVLSQFPASSVDLVSSRHFMEHVSDVDLLLKEITRILKPGGEIEVIVPHFSNPYFYSDPTHRAAFGLYTFCYYAESILFRKKIPEYCKIDKLKLNSVQLTFRSFRPNYIRHGLKKLIEKLVNISSFTKEFYEENLSWIFPCYEVRYIISKLEENDS